MIIGATVKFGLLTAAPGDEAGICGDGVARREVSCAAIVVQKMEKKIRKAAVYRPIFIKSSAVELVEMTKNRILN